MSQKAIEEKPLKKENKQKERDVFREIWKEREHVSEVSGKKIYGDLLTVYMHHILPKEFYKEAILDKDNIIILTWEEHDIVERDENMFEEINKRRIKLKEKYG